MSEETRESADRTRGLILRDISIERDRQDAKWGGIPGIERRDDHTYPAVLTEEVGEACQAWLQRDVAALREELVQVAAVAVAWVEELDNGGMLERSRFAPMPTVRLPASVPAGAPGDADE